MCYFYITHYPTMFNNLSDTEIADLHDTINDLIDNYIEDNMIYIFNPDFKDEMIKSITELVVNDYLYSIEIIVSDEDNEEIYSSIEELTEECIDNYCIYNKIPKRSNSITFEEDGLENKEYLSKTIDYLKNQEQPQQKTREWYLFRYNLITASNLWKVFGTDSQVNSLIYEKCKPFQEYNYESMQSGPLFWGIKYEPVTIMIYEQMFNTKIADFGCIKHPIYSFIGASPDGINVETSNMRYGRMLEIKNIFNREITGIPKKEYWIQMQLQMEVCRLNKCDFVETRIKEFTDQEEFMENKDKYEYKGMVVELLPKFKPCDMSNNNEVLAMNKNKFVYELLSNEDDEESIDSINQRIKTDNENHYIYEIKYWYLDEFSCVLVHRNTLWFEKSVPEIEKIWSTIEKERVGGYEHRASKKRTSSVDNTQRNGCLLEMSDDST